MSLNHLQVALHIYNSNDEETIVKVTENQVILSTIPNAPIFPFNHVYDMNIQDLTMFQHIAHSIVNELIEGNDACIAIYDASSRNRFDTNIMLAFSELFQLKKCEISIKYVEADGYGTIQDLIAREDDEGREYKVDNIAIVEEYYKFGVDHQRSGSVSLFSIIFKQKLGVSKLNILDLSGCSHDTLDSFADICINRYNNTGKSSLMNDNLKPIFSHIEASSALYVLACVSHSDPITQLENTLSYAFNIYENTAYRNEKMKSSPSLKHRSIQNDDTEYLRRIILKLTNEVNTLRYTRASVNTITSSENNEPRHASMFSSISNSTSMTVPDPIYEEKVTISDLNRQIEELENQISVTRERNTHVERELQQRIASQDQLLSIHEKQDCIIDKLEWKLDEMERLNDELYGKLVAEAEKSNNLKEQVEHELASVKRDVRALNNERNQLDGVLCVMENMNYKSDKDTSQALQELAALKMLSHQQDQNLKIKDEEIESLSYQLYHTNMTTQRKLLKSIDLNDSANSSVIIFNHDQRALESRIEELDEMIEHIRDQRDKYCDQLEERTDQVEKLKEQGTIQAAKLSASEKRICELEEELKSIYLMMREQDFTGFVRKLEDEVTVLQQQKLADQKDFETVVSEMETMSTRMHKQLDNIERLESTVSKLNQQLDETTSGYIQKEEDLLELRDQLEMEKNTNLMYHQKELERKASVADQHSKPLPVRSDSLRHAGKHLRNKNDISHWVYEKLNDPNGGKAEVIRKFVQLSNENSQKTLCIDDLDKQILELRYQLTLASYESSKPSSSSLSLNSRRKAKSGSTGSYSLIYKNPSTSTELKERDSVQSDGSRYIPSRQSGSSSLPPPCEPPCNPLPPVPMLPYIPNSNSTCPSPSAHQMLGSTQSNLTRCDSQASAHSVTSNDLDIVAPMDYHDQRPRSHRLKSHVAGSQTSNEAVDITFQFTAMQTKIKDQQHEIEMLLNDQAAHETLKNQMNMQALELKNERALKLKAEKAHYILERRMEELMNAKKNKFRCF